jgi:cellulose synthase/poly-beta-1,6-N-acetylglucosamine synthase-like glycosyltransferase
MVIGVCTYNRGPQIVRTLAALDAMDPVDEEGSPRLARVVIVNNRSTDDTVKVVERFIANRGGGVPFDLIHEDTPGKTHAMLRLFRDTREPIACVVDDDTVPERGWAKAMLSVFDDQPRAGVVGGPVWNVWESGPTRTALRYRRSLGDQLMGDDRVKLADPMSFLMGASLAIRRRAIEDSGWLGGSLLASRTGTSLECGAEDAEICIRIRRAGWEVWYEPGARMGHLIPARRQTPEYLARLREAICRGEPWVRWVAEGEPGSAWAEPHRRRARLKFFKSFFFDWRPTRRRIRVAERRGRAQGWDALARHLAAARPTPAAHPS